MNTQEIMIQRLSTIDRLNPVEGAVSERYRHVNTTDVVRGLVANGFTVANVQAKKSSAHIVRLRPVDARPVVSSNPNLNGLIPEVVLKSAYDGSSAFTLTAGVFRIVCLNGLIVGSGLVERIVHVGDALNKTMVAASRIANETPQIVERIERLGEVTLTDAARIDFARKASDLVLSDNALRSELTAKQLLTPVRRGDEARDLWTTFNVVQERLMKGGYQVIKGAPHFRGSSIRWYAEKARAISSVDRTYQVNRDLWSLAESYIA